MDVRRGLQNRSVGRPDVADEKWRSLINFSTKNGYDNFHILPTSAPSLIFIYWGQITSPVAEARPIIFFNFFPPSSSSIPRWFDLSPLTTCSRPIHRCPCPLPPSHFLWLITVLLLTWRDKSTIGLRDIQEKVLGKLPRSFYIIHMVHVKIQLFLFMYYIQHCFICRPSDSIVPTDAGIEPRTVANGVLRVKRSNH